MESVPRTADVVVIGGGAIGASVAYALARRGVGVHVLERDRVGSGASAGTACMVTPSHSDRLASPASLREGVRHLLDPTAPVALRPRPRSIGWMARFASASARGASADAGTTRLRELARRSLALHQAWDAALGTGLHVNGTLNVWHGDDAEARRDAYVETARAAGFAIEALDEAGVRALEPDVTGDAVGALCPEDGHVDSLDLVQRVMDGARAAGGHVLEGVEVLRIDRSGPRLRVATTRGEITCSQVVLAAGAWARRFAVDLGATLPIIPAKGYHVEFAGAAASSRRPVYLTDAHVVATPLAGRLRLAGTLEIGTDPDVVDHRRVEAVRAAGAAAIDGLAGAEPTGIWKGLRPLSADDMPLIGPLPGDPRVTLAVGHGTLGITLAPVTGELVADLVTGVEDEADPLVDPARFRRAPRPRLSRRG